LPFKVKLGSAEKWQTQIVQQFQMAAKVRVTIALGEIPMTEDRAMVIAYW
jgi:hypothetical protein